jgi:hypothetical protein
MDICNSNTNKLLKITAFFIFVFFCFYAILATPVPIIVCSLARSFDYLSKDNDYNHLVSSTYKLLSNKLLTKLVLLIKV